MDIEHGLNFSGGGVMGARRKPFRKLMAGKPANDRGWKELALKAEKERDEAEAKLFDYVFIDKKPDYFFSFSGFLLFRRWHLLNGISAPEAELLIIMSYVDVFLLRHFKLYTRNHTRVPVRDLVDLLTKQGYIVKIKIPGRSPSSFRTGWVLTQRGKDLEGDYERFYDLQMSVIKKGVLYGFNFEDGAYFRKVYISNREKKKNGGDQPKRGNGLSNFIEPEQVKSNWIKTVDEI